MKPSLDFEGQHIAAEDFFQRYQRAAVALRAAGVGEGDVVALLMRNGPDLLELMLAARWIGALWCPINWHFKADEVQYILSDSGAKVLIADAALLESLLTGPAGLKLEGINTFVTGRDGDSSVRPRWTAYRDAVTAPNLAASAPRGVTARWPGSVLADADVAANNNVAQALISAAAAHARRRERVGAVMSGRPCDAVRMAMLPDGALGSCHKGGVSAIRSCGAHQQSAYCQRRRAGADPSRHGSNLVPIAVRMTTSKGCPPVRRHH